MAASVTDPFSPRILVLNASPRPHGHTSQLLHVAAQAFPSAGSLAPDYRRLEDRSSSSEAPAIPTYAFDDLARAWMAADAVLLGAPVYTFGAPAPLYAFFQCLRRLQAELPAAELPKPVAIIVQGGGEYSGAEEAAQSLLRQILSVDGLPVSGDVPGASQGVVGQVPDVGAPSPALLASCRRLGIRLAEMCRILAAGQKAPLPRPPRLLAIVAAASLHAEAQDLLAAVLADAGDDDGPIETEAFDVDGLAITPCQACSEYCSANLECIYDDGMQVLRRRLAAADAVAWIVEAETGGPDPAVRAAIDRMNQVRYETHFARHEAHMSRRLQAVGTLALGNDPVRVAGALQFFDQYALMVQGAPVKIGGGGPAAGNGLCLEPGDRLSPQMLGAARTLGRRLVRLARVLRAGVAAADLPPEYYPSSS